MKALVSFAVIVCLAGASLSCQAAEETGPKKGDKVIDFALKDLSGKEVKTVDARKGKVVLLKFGATWCGWCNKEIADLKQVVKEYAGKVVVLDIDVSEEAEVVKKHNEKNATTYTTLLDPDAAAAKKYGVEGIPVVIVAGKDGTIAYRGYYTPFEELKKVIDDLLKE